MEEVVGGANMSEKRLNNSIFLIYLVSNSYIKRITFQKKNLKGWMKSLKF